MLSKQNRLQRNRDIRKALQRGKRLSAGPLTAVSILTNKKNTRATVLVSTKVAKHSVDRNRIKRQVRALIARTVVSNNTKPQDMVITVRQLAPYAELERAVSELEKQMHLL